MLVTVLPRCTGIGDNLAGLGWSVDKCCVVPDLCTALYLDSLIKDLIWKFCYITNPACWSLPLLQRILLACVAIVHSAEALLNL